MTMSASGSEKYQMISRIPAEYKFASYFKAQRIGAIVITSSSSSNTGEIVAIKSIRFEDEDEGVPAESMRLISALKNLQHPNIVKILDIDFRKLDAAGYPVRLWIVMEFVDQRPDWDAFERTVPAADVRPIIRQVLSGLAYSHAHQIVYRMLCPRSILLDHDGKVKLTRFSGCRSIDVLNPAYTPETMVLWYRPPEILLGNDHYTPAVDMWSCACIMVELLSRQPLFPGDSQIDQLFKIFRLCGTPSDEVWPDVSSLPHFLPTFPKWPRNRHALMQLISADPAALDLIERMLVYDPQRRISAHDALQHPYFAGMPPLEEPAAAHQAAVRMPWQTSAAFGGMIQPSASWEPRVQYDFAPGRESADDIPAS